MDYNELYHYGVKGQKWGIRRYQNPDGTLTEEGKKRYRTVDNLSKKRKQANIKKAVVAAIGVATVAAATAYVAKNPEVILTVSEKLAKVGTSVKDLPKTTVTKGKRFVKKISALRAEHKEVSKIMKERHHDVKILPKLSDEELGKLHKRLELEQRVKSLATDEVSAGKRYVSDSLIKAGASVLTTAVVGGAAYAGKKVTEKKVDREAAGYMFPNPNRKKK